MIMKMLCVYPMLYVLAKAAIASHESSEVTPPNNVTMVCQNGTNIAFWNYTATSPAEFSVKVKSYTDDKILLQKRTSQHYIDMSSVTSPNDKDEYYLYLRTLDGPRSSEEVILTFSYSMGLKTDVECAMDFPSVNVTVKSNWTIFSFTNPLLPGFDYEDGYEEGYDDEYYVQNDTLSPSDDNFYYTVYTTHDQKSLSLQCPLEDTVCRGELPLRDCTTLELEGNIDGIRYRHSKDICNITPEKDHWPIYLSAVICIIVLVSLVVILLGTRKCVKKFLSSHHLPETLTHSRVPGAPCILQPESAGRAPLLQISPTDPQTPENSPTDPQTVIPTEISPERTHFHIPSPNPDLDPSPVLVPVVAPVPTSGSQLGDAYEARVGHDLDLDLDHEPQPQLEGDEGSDDGYMQRERLTETPDSPYNSSINDTAIEIEIAPGDNVSGYGPR